MQRHEGLMTQQLLGGVYLITDESRSDDETLSAVEQALRGGVRCVQLRDKLRSANDLYRLALRLRVLTARSAAAFIVNDRIDLALAVGADGVHIGQDDIPARDARRLLGRERILGVSADTPERARRAVSDGADYLGVGHVFGSISKSKETPPIGVQGLRAVADEVAVPIVAIGAIGPDNAADAVEAGASAVAVISAVSRADNPETAARELSSLVRAAYEARRSAERRAEPPEPHPKRAAAALQTLRSRRPLVQIITNYVVMNDTANATRLLGALPVMSEAEEEVDEMVRQARALLVNTGTPVKPRVRAMRRAAESAARAGVPMVLDPVGCGATGFRIELNRRLALDGGPAVVRGNAAEIAALIGRRAEILGVEDAGESATQQLQFRIELAQAAAAQLGCVVAVTGPVDVVADGAGELPRTVLVRNGSALLSQVVGTGCVVSALIAAFAATESDPFAAACWGLGIMGVAAERAAERAAGRAAECAGDHATPATRAQEDRAPEIALGPLRFKTELLDQLALLQPEEFAAMLRLEWVAGPNSSRGE